MSKLQIWTTAALATLCFMAANAPCCADIMSGRRYFYSGDGNINLVNGKNGKVFDGRYRQEDGSYDGKALEEINRIFGAEYDIPLSRISLRLIEFLDYLQDYFRPGAQIMIASGWRSPEYNTGLRNKGRLAAKASLHQYGMAADIQMAGVSSEHIWNYVKELGFGGAGYYHGDLVHVDVGPARSWDETTSGVGTDISEHNKLIGLVTEFDLYRPGEQISLRFIRMTAFPIGVLPEFALDRVGMDGRSGIAGLFKPLFAIDAKGGCPHFADIGEMMGISYQLPENMPPGRYMIRASFCERPWADMPVEISTPIFEIERR
ncbi:MAG: DUF882 domain-containing protein [Desulforhabdus sp.]|jgi:uncharacterized protein YcbK (DUF882 family)|nr:DUF882 domain-containing protein [Desulforhabdus sp.]